MQRAQDTEGGRSTKDRGPGKEHITPSISNSTTTTLTPDTKNNISASYQKGHQNAITIDNTQYPTTPTPTMPTRPPGRSTNPPLEPHTPPTQQPTPSTTYSPPNQSETRSFFQDKTTSKISVAFQNVNRSDTNSHCLLQLARHHDVVIIAEPRIISIHNSHTQISHPSFQLITPATDTPRYPST